MTAVQPIQANPAQATTLPEPLRPAARPRTAYWDAADCCWHTGDVAAEIPAQRDGD